MAVVEVEIRSAVASIVRRQDAARRGVALVWTCAWLALPSGCSFEQSPLVSSTGPHVSLPSSSGSAGTGAGQPGAPSSSGSMSPGSAGAGSAPGVQPPPGAGAATEPMGGSTAEPPEDAGWQSDDELVDAGGGDEDEPDTGTPSSGCGKIPECVCGHDRLETPSDPCAAPDCPLDECAPDEDCELKRFDSSVYYLCATPRPQEMAAMRCAEIDGMHLVYVEGEDEDDFLDDEVSGKVWIGATIDEDGVWSWGDGTPFYDEESGEPVDDAYVDWDQSSAEPNGLGVGSGEVTCAILWEDTGAWADTNCPALNPYVCEREL